MPKAVSVAVVESRQDILHEVNREKYTLSQLINEMREKVPQFKGADERRVFITAYGDPRAGLQAYKKVDKIFDTCVRSFCLARLKRQDVADALRKQQESMLEFLAANPA